MSRSPFHKLDEIATALFKDAAPRPQAGTSGGITAGGPADAAALGALLVWKLVQHGGCRLPVGAAQQATETLLGELPEIQRHRVEREAAEVLRWLEDSLSLFDPEWEDVEDRGLYPWEDREFPPEGKPELIRSAIESAHDLEIEYFTYSRNALSRRRITPLEMHGDSRLRALCHWRRDERHFLLRRIKEVRRIQKSP
ncbi:MAG: hypothetical protein PVF68_00910 [Acidobacteriota bacterium]|jgi:predicted DNA-binding transcriptional regulator YafY